MSALLDRIAAEHAAVADSLAASTVARAHRRRALDALVASGMPTTRDENWRYANLRPLERVRFAPAGAPAAASAGGAREDVPPLPPAISGFTRYAFINGRFAPSASTAIAHRPDASVAISTGAPGGFRAFDGADPRPDAAFALLNEAFATDGLRIEVGEREGRDGGAPARIEVVFFASAPPQQGASYPRLAVTAAPRSRLELIERHVSPSEDGSFVASAVEVHANEGATVEHYRIQQLAPRAIWMDTLAGSLARDATYRLHAYTLGAQSARSTLQLGLAGERAELGLHAVAAGDRQQVLDAYAVVEHAAGRTRTEETFRGIAGGRSRVAFNGKIIVRPGARGADSSQSLRGLLAGPEAEIDVRPQLEIYTDDVRCSHGATAGKLDDAMLFYLLSRGIDRDTAQRLLKWAFLEDVVSKVGIAELRRHIETSLAGQLQDAEALKELL